MKVIIAYKSHQLCNRLLVFSAFVANAIEYGYKVYNPGFEDYADQFLHLENNLLVRYPEIRREKKHIPFKVQLRRGYYELLNFLTRLFFSKKIVILRTRAINDHFFGGFGVFLERENFQQLISELNTLMVIGYGYRDWKNLVKHQDRVREFFQPNNGHKIAIDRLFSEIAAKKYDVLIGVHMRRGDYKEYQDGKYYYDDSVYLNAMKSLREEFTGKDVGFLICSNEVPNDSYFQGFSVHFGPGHFIQDLYSLAKCDYIFGPPSTFSFWASFIGNCKIAQLIQKDTLLKVSDFYNWHQIKI